jgi:WD40 repeat protein
MDTSMARGEFPMREEQGVPFFGFPIRPTTRAWGSCLCNLVVVTTLVVVFRVYHDPGEDSRTSAKSRPLAVIGSEEGPISSITWSPDSKTLVMAGVGPLIRTWDAGSGRIGTLGVREVEEEGTLRKLPVLAVAFSPVKRVLAIGNAEGLVTIQDFDTGNRIATLAGRDKIRALSWSSDGRSLAVGATDVEIRLWDFEEDRVRVLAMSSQTHSNVTWSPDDRTIASVRGDGLLQLWDSSTVAGRLCFQSHASYVADVDFTRDGGSVIVADLAGPTRAWDITTGNERVAPGFAARGATAVAISPDGRRFATASSGAIITVGDIASGREVKHLDGHTGAVSVLAWSPDGCFLASASYSGTVRVWDLSSDQ